MYSDSLAGLLLDQSQQSIRYDALMPHRVRHILLISSLYDSHTFVEDGGVSDMLFSTYLELNLRSPPRIDRVSTAARALENLKTTRYDLVISMLRIGAMDLRELGARVQALAPGLPVLLLAFNARELRLIEEMGPLPGIDRVFMWSGDTRIFLAMVMYVEDRLNARHDAESAGVPLIVLVEDSAHFYSRYLSILYTEIMTQTRALLADGLNQAERMRRQYARPKILLATSYEEGLALYSQYAQWLIGIILDAAFPRGGKVDPKAGLDFAQMARAGDADLAILLQSSDGENHAAAIQLAVAFIDKESPRLLQEVREFMRRDLGFGQFVFRRMDDSIVTTASDLREFGEALEMIPDESLLRHSRKKAFSTWLRARTEFDMAHAIGSCQESAFSSTREYRTHLVAAVKRHRTRSRAGIVSEFSEGTFDGESGFVRIGQGSLGGKGRGLAFLHSLVARYALAEQIAGVRLFVPPTAVLATDVFDQCVAMGGLQGLLRGDMDDDKVRRVLLGAALPDDVVSMLRTFLRRVHYPLAVRSSSKLEDSSHQPFAGVYRTVMLPNNHSSDDIRLRELLNAVKLVYASTYQSDARSYLEKTPNRLEEEKMAVVIQQVVGRQHDQYLYPDVAGVVRSHNFYPVRTMRATDGVISAVLGMGKAAVEGCRCLRFSPVAPESLFAVLTPRDYLNNAQRDFHALDLFAPGPAAEDAASAYTEMRCLGLDVAQTHGTFALVGSVYSPRDHTILDDVDTPGVKLVTMSRLFTDPALNLAKALAFVLRVGQAGLSCPVEVEFAATISQDQTRPISLSLLQIRPMVIDASGDRMDPARLSRGNAICVSEYALGHGLFTGIRDIVYVRPDTFTRSATGEIADEIGTINRALKEANRPFVLIGPGRWGSADLRLGIPVSWAQISQVGCIVETPLADLRVSPSQGSHFFQNITSFGIGYFTVSSENAVSFLNRRWLDEQQAATVTPHIRHLAFDKPLDLFVDSVTGVGAIMKPGHHALSESR